MKKKTKAPQKKKTVKKKKTPSVSMACCERCRYYWTCESKWYRGEHGQKPVCCSLCVFFRPCSAMILDAMGKK